MCEHDRRVVAINSPCTGSRRRRIWELGEHAHCPVVGVCLPIRALRRLVDKVVGGTAVGDDYELHCGVIAECKQRGPMAEAMQRELERRYALALRQAARAKSAGTLSTGWREVLAGDDVAGALWATLTHARCDAALEERVLRDIHMLQHQVGAANRADLQRLHEAMDENAVLARELAAAQQRSTSLTQQQGRKIEQRPRARSARRARGRVQPLVRAAQLVAARRHRQGAARHSGAGLSGDARIGPRVVVAPALGHRMAR